jgi:phage-related protein
MTGTDGYGCRWRLSMVRSEINSITDEDARGWLLAAMGEYAKGHLSASKVKPIGEGILEITVNRGGVFLRCLFYHPMPFIAVGLKVYMKKSNKLPKQHLQTARARRQAWEAGQ